MPVCLRAEPYGHRIQPQIRQCPSDHGGADTTALPGGEYHEGAPVFEFQGGQYTCLMKGDRPFPAFRLMMIEFDCAALLTK